MNSLVMDAFEKIASEAGSAHEGEQEADDDLEGDSVCSSSRLPGGAREACRVGGNEGRDEVLQRLGCSTMPRVACMSDGRARGRR